MIFNSPYPNLDIPTDLTLTEFIFQQVETLADKPALIDGPTGRTLTYRQLYGAIHAVAAGLAQRGFKKGDVFAIYLPNLPEYAVCFHAVAVLGGINTTINPLYTAGELAKQLNDSQAKYLLTISMFMDKAQEAAAQSSVEEIFSLDEAAGATPFASLMQPGGDLPQVDIDPQQDLVVLPYSSGTTSLPKGTMLTHHNLIANLCQIENIDSFDEGYTLIAVLPFFHIYGMVAIMSLGLYRRTTIVSMPRFDLEQFLQLIQEHRVTGAYLVPPIMLALAKHPLVSKYDLSSLEMILSGAAPLSGEIALACQNRLGCVVKQGYGMTEMSPVTHIASADFGPIKMDSVGHLVANTQARVVDTSTGNDVGPNENGELWVRGPQRMVGYLNNPDITAASIDADGWYHTGDIGYVDDEGYWFIVDRVKELIKYKGMQVAPAELEALLLTHAAVIDAAVIPSPDEEAGEIPKAFVVLSGETQPSAEELMTFVAEKVAPHKKVRQVEIVDQIPKSASGKILRRVLVAQEREKASA